MYYLLYVVRYYYSNTKLLTSKFWTALNIDNI